VITATQMLDSMIRNPRPTRAEAADVANAILDGSDAVMLSGETAAGKYPLEAVRMMDAICCDVEESFLGEGVEGEITSFDTHPRDRWAFVDAAARGSAQLSWTLPLSAIVTFTRDGRTARLLSEYRPRSIVVAITSRREVANRLALEWGVLPRVEVPPDTLEEALRVARHLRCVLRMHQPPIPRERVGPDLRALEAEQREVGVGEHEPLGGGEREGADARLNEGLLERPRSAVQLGVAPHRRRAYGRAPALAKAGCGVTVHERAPTLTRRG